MPDSEKIIRKFLLEDYPKKNVFKIISIKSYYEFNKIIDKLLKRKKRNSYIIKLITANNEKKELFAVRKNHHEESGPEYKILLRHWKNHYHQNQRYKIPAPFAWIPEHKILITEKSEGLLLSKILMFLLLPGINLFTKKYIYKNLSISIDWLIDFQKYTVKNESFNFLNLYNTSRKKIGMLHEDWMIIAESIFNQIDCTKISELDVPQVDWHGDFLHRNILIQNKTVTVFDWEGHWKFESIHPIYELYRFIFSLFLINRRSIYSFKKTKEIANWTLQYYINHTFINIDYEAYKAIYLLFLIDMIYNYDKQVKGLSISENKKHTALIKKISEIKFEDIFYD